MAVSYSPLGRKAVDEKFSKFGRNIFVAIVTLCVFLSVLCLVAVTVTYIEHQRVKSCSCSSTQLYHISGFDPEIQWTPALSMQDSSAFEEAALQEEHTMRQKISHKYNVDDIEVTEFSQAQNTHGLIAGAIFYASLTLRGTTIPTTDELKLALRAPEHAANLDAGFRIFDVNTVHHLVQLGKRHRVAKRSIDQMQEEEEDELDGDQLPPFRAGGCQPGFTGKFCQIALCTTKGVAPLAVPFPVGVDVQYFSICSATSGFPVDSHTNAIYATLIAVSPASYKQRMSLIDPQGNIVPMNRLIVRINTTSTLQYKLNNPMPGQWAAQYSGPIACVFAASANRSFEIFSGYLAGPNAIHSDNPTSAMYPGQPSYMVAHASGLQCPGKIRFLEVYANNNLVFSSPAQTRYHCAYEKYFGLITCNPLYFYMYKIYGIDDNGYTFERTDLLQCSSNATTPTPPPPQCQNGGTPVGNNTCLCPVYFTGPRCGISICVNGGTPSGSGTCICPAGYNGTHCQNIVCQPHPNVNFNTANRTLVIVLGTRASMGQDVVGIQSAASNIINSWAANHRGVLTNYVLATYLDSQVQTNTFTSPTQFLAFLATVFANKNFQNCDQGVLQAVANSLFQSTSPIQPRSPVFIFTDAAAMDYQLAESIIVQNVAGINAQLNFIVTNTSMYGCPLNTNSPGYNAYLGLAFSTQGLVMRVPKLNVGQTFQNYYNALYGTDSTYQADYPICANQPQFTPVFVDSTMVSMIISATGDSISSTPALILTNPNGTQAVPSSSYMSGNFRYWIFQNPSPGAYIVRVSVPSGACSVRVRGQTQMQLFYGFTNSFNMDYSQAEPVLNVPINMVAHLQFYSQWLLGQSSQAIISSGSPTNFVYFSSGRYRASNCQYKLLFSKFTCTSPGQIFYLTVFGNDLNGFEFQRSATGFCSAEMRDVFAAPITPSPPLPCHNGGVPYNGGCICPPLWTGQYCTIPVCFNGGTPLSSGVCSCPNGWSGTHCGLDVCTSRNPNIPIGPNGRTLAIVIENTYQNYLVLSQIQQQIGNLISQIRAQNTLWIQSYILVTFTDTGTSQPIQTSDTNQFINAVRAVVPQTRTNCPTMSGNALIQALRLTNQYGYVFLFTQSSMGDTNQMGALFNLVELTRASVSVVMTSTNPCNSNFTTPGVVVFIYLTSLSSGQFFVVELAATTGIINYIPTMYSTSIAGVGSKSNCGGSSMATFFFPIDGHARSFTVAAAGDQPTLRIYAPNGTPYTGNSLLNTSRYATITQIGSRQFPRGIWRATVQTMSATGCNLYVRPQSNLNLYYGFVRDIHSDFPTKEPLNITSGLSNHMVAHVTNLPSTGTLEYMIMFDSSFNLLGEGMFGKRSGCSYEYISEGFRCSAPGFGILASGYDEQGYLYQRIQTAVCIPPGNACQNGGVSVNGTCICSPLWTGPLCSQAVCLNGGTNVGSTCACPAGFTGTHCYYDMCTKLVPADFSAGHRSLVFIVDTTTTNAFSLQQLKANLPAFLQRVNNLYPSWFYNYILVPVGDPGSNSGPIIGTVTVTQSSTAFATAVNQLQTTVDSGNDCQNPTLHGVQAALNVAAFQQNSLVYLFTQATAKDTNLYGSVITQIINTRAIVNVIFDNLNPCNSNGSTPGASVYMGMTGLSGGAIILSQPTTKAQELNFIGTQYQRARVAIFQQNNCSRVVDYFAVDSHIISFTFTFVGYMPTMTLRNTNGAIVSYTTVLSDTQELIGTVTAVTPGIWAAMYSTLSGACRINIYAQTTLRLYYGFALDMHSDSPQPFAYPGNTTQNYMLAHMSNLPTGATLEYARFYDSNINLLNVVTFSPRASCSYDYYSQPFSCQYSYFGLAINGIDEKGYLYQRIGVVPCPSLTCLNGGVSYNGQCICPPLWTGPTCASAICLNGGTSLSNGSCSCLAGWTGTHCLFDVCSSRNPNVPVGPNGRTMAIVIENSFQNYLVLRQIQQQIGNLISQIRAQNTLWIQSYILVTFTDTGTSQPVQTSDTNQFMNAVLAVVPQGKTNCPAMSGNALRQALQLTSQYGYVFLFTQSSMADTNQISTLFNLVSVVMANTNPCNTNFTTPSVTVFFYLAALSSGQFFVVEPAATLGILSYIPTLYSTSVAADHSQGNCAGSSMQTFFFAIDAHTRSFTLTALGNQPNVKIYTPTGALYTGHSILNNSNYASITQVGIQGQRFPGGIWSATLQTMGSSGCSLQVRPQSNLNLYYGFVRDIHSDFPTMEPLNVTGYSDHMVVHMTNLLPTGTLEYMNMFDISNNLLGAAMFGRRSACSYEYISQAFSCPSTGFAILASGYDEQGYLYQRIQTAICIPPSNACQNGGVSVNGTCICSPLWTGPQCAQAVCLNGGTNVGSTCACAPGFTGVHCYYDMCTQMVQRNFSAGHRSLVFIVDTTITNALGIQELKMTLPAFLQRVNSLYPNWFYNYILVPVGDPGNSSLPIIGTVTVTLSSATFMAAVNQLSFTMDSGNDCPNPTLHGMQAGLNVVQLQPNSLVYLFTKATAKDTSLYSGILTQIASTGAQVNVILEALNPCNSNFITSGALVYVGMPAVSGGSLILSEPTMTSQALNFIATQYQSARVAVFQQQNCSRSVDILAVDSHTTSFTFTFIGYQPTITWRNSSGSVIPYTTVLSDPAELIGTINAVTPGIWMATYSSQTGGCTINIYAQTTLRAYFGYTLDIHSDSPQALAYSGPCNIPPEYGLLAERFGNTFICLATQNYMLAHITNLPTGATLEYAEFYGNNLNLLNVATFSPRRSCSYDYYSQPFSCPGPFFGVVLNGVDENGYLYQRVGVSQCPTITCMNGGVNYNGQCVCPPAWTGQTCGTAVCFNGGTSLGSTCSCAQGWSGPHCYMDMCTAQNPNVINGPNNRSLAFVVQSTITTYFDVQQIKQQINYVLSQINQQSPLWYTSFTLVTFTGTTATTLITTSSPSLFAQTIQNIQANAAAACPKPIGLALINALQMTSKYGSVYVFTDSVMGDINTQAGNVFALLESTKATVNFIITNPNPCGSNFSTSGANIMYVMARFSDGEFFVATKPDVTALLRYVPLTYQSGLVGEFSSADCRLPRFFFFPVDSHTTSFTLIVSGYQSVVQIHDATGKIHAATPVVTSSLYVKIYQVYTRGGTHNATSPILAGIWTAIVATYPVAGIPTGCIVDVRAQSNLQLYYGFVLNPHNDFPFGQPLNITGNPNSMVAHVTNLNSSGILEYMTMYGIGGQQIGAATFMRRFGCGYEYISQQFRCAQSGFGIVAAGYDENGYLFNRIRTAVCVTPTTQCQNGGVYYGNTCICPATWTGPTCTTIVCFNGGTSMGTVCSCPTGWSGPNCGINICPAKNPLVMNSANNRTLAFVVQDTIGMGSDIQQIQNQIMTLLTQAHQQNMMWFNSYVLITFNDAVVQTQTITSNPTTFASAVNSLRTHIHTGTCAKMTATAIQTALAACNPYSLVYVFTDATMGDFYALPTLYQLLESTKAAVSFVMSNVNPCNSNFTTSGAIRLYQISAFSDGQFMVVQKPAVTAILGYIPLLYSSGLVFTSTSLSCVTPQTYFVPIDSHTSSFTITAVGYNPKMIIWNPNGQIYSAAAVVNATGLVILRAYDNAGVTPYMPGIWTFALTTTAMPGGLSGCQIQVRAQSNLNLYYGFVQNMHYDFPTGEPVNKTGYTDRMVAHMTNLPQTGTLEYMNMYTFGLVGSATFSRRQGCGYEFVSQGFNCPSSAFGIVVSGYDEQMYLYNRIRIAVCVPSASACQNGGVLYQGSCICSPLWTGPICSQAVCLNGGTNQGSRCLCPPNFTGAHCIYDICPNMVPANLGPYNQTLGIVIDTTLMDALLLQQLKTAIPAFLQTVLTGLPNWFQNVLLIPYSNPVNGQNIVGTITNTQSVSAFTAAIRALTPLSGNGTCHVPSLHGLQAALGLLNQNSPVYLFTMGFPSDLSMTNSILQLIALTRAQINVVFGTLNPCQENFNNTNALTVTYLTSVSGGSVFLTTPTNMNAFVASYLVTGFSSGLLLYGNQPDCSKSQGLVWYVAVDSYAVSMTFVFYGFQPVTTWRNSTGSLVPVTTTVISNQVQSVGIIGTPGPGIWRVATYTTYGSCGFQINIQSQLQVYFGFVTDIHNDLALPTAIAGVPNYIIAHVSSLPYGGTLEYAQIYLSNYQLVNTVTFYPRTGCSYDYISQPITCPARYFMLVFTGYDDKGMMYDRMKVVNCPSAT